MAFPTLPARAAYLHLNNPSRRNALSLSVLRDLKAQLLAFNTSRITNKPLLLPPFNPSILDSLERISSQGHAISQGGHSPEEDYAWLLSSSAWIQHREHLPTVLVLRSPGPIFSSGHDLREIRSLPPSSVRETFALCAELMTLLRRSPTPVVCAVQGLATAAGLQLALSTDIPVALSDTKVQLPGASIGLPCTSPSAAVSRRLPPGLTYRLLATAESIEAGHPALAGAMDVVPVPPHAEARDTAKEAFEARVDEVVRTLAGRAAQPAALGKWAFWTQMGFRSEGDGYEDAAAWAGRVMALHARSEDAREGVDAFLEKRKPQWTT